MACRSRQMSSRGGKKAAETGILSFHKRQKTEDLSLHWRRPLRRGRQHIERYAQNIHKKF